MKRSALLHHRWAQHVDFARRAVLEALKEAAAERGQPVAALVEEIDAKRGTTGLSSAVRVWLLEYYRSCCGKQTDEGSQLPERLGRGH